MRKMKENRTFEDFTIKLKHDTALDVGMSTLSFLFIIYPENCSIQIALA